MKKALSCKIIFLCIACALCFVLAFSFLTVKTARAANINNDNIASYFRDADDEHAVEKEKITLKDNSLVATATNNKNKLKIKNALVIDDLTLTLNIPDGVKEFTITLTSDSYFVNGIQKDGSDNFDKDIDNVLIVKMTENKIALNNVENAAVLAAGNMTVKFTTASNVLSAEVAGVTVTNDNIYYKIKGEDKCSAIVSFEFTLKDDTESADISFISIGQKTGEADYTQTFALDADQKIADFARSRAIINDLPILKDGDGKLKVILGKQYKNLSFTTYSVFGNVSSGNVYVKSDSEGVSVDPYNTKPTSVIFNNTVNADDGLKLCYKDGDTEKVLETYNVLAAENRDNDNAAPTYKADGEIFDQYKKLVQNAAKKEYFDDGKPIKVKDENGNDTDPSIRLGDTYEIPSLKDLVKDDCNVYSDLTYTVYYRTPSNASGSTSSLKFTVSEAGKYEFYVIFKDENENALDKDDFYKVDEEDGNHIIDGTYKYAVFTFDIKDDAPISVEVPETQGAGYLNTKYVASGFEVLSGSNVTYTLYYNEKTDAKANSDGWVAVNAESDYFTEDEIESIGYDGKYTFTPIKIGSYKIKCEASSGTSSSARYDSGETVISVSEEPSVVKPDNHWFRNNVWSLVFLSVGTLSLIGIIVLLFIKPKEEVETDETGEALNISDKK